MIVDPTHILTDSFQRKHTYLRISLTEKCNLRCTYCMPADGVSLTPKSHLMTAAEIFTIAEAFVKLGVTKIRLTGGEPLVRKDFPEIIARLATLAVDIAITTNGILIERFLPLLKKHNITAITISLDTLSKEKFQVITRRNEYETVWNSIQTLLTEGIYVKINIVLIKGVNDTEIIDFIQLTKHYKCSVRFIEFMPFDGNRWNTNKIVSAQEILDQVQYHFPLQIERLQDAAHDTSKNYKITGYQGHFAIISSVTNPFCDTCNRIRLTADGHLKNCLFSNHETSLLTPLRAGQSIIPQIQMAMQQKFATRGGMDTNEKLENPTLHTQNRSMITIGG